MVDVANTIRQFIVNELMQERNESLLEFNDPILENGIIDSMGIQMLSAFLEKQFNISVPTDELVPENFETINAVSNLVKKLKNNH